MEGGLRYSKTTLRICRSKTGIDEERMYRNTFGQCSCSGVEPILQGLNGRIDFLVGVRTACCVELRRR